MPQQNACAHRNAETPLKQFGEGQPQGATTLNSRMMKHTHNFTVQQQHHTPMRNHEHVCVQGLQDVIGLSVVHPTWQATRPGVDEHRGWTFAADGDPPFEHPSGSETYPVKDCIPDTVNGTKFVRDIYDMSGVPAGMLLCCS
jgi:hypothetical protein